MKNRFSWLGVYLLLALILLLEVIEMPQFSDGQKMNEALVWNRLIESIPASYVVWKDGDTYRAECLLKDGTDYSGTDASAVIQDALDALTAGRTWKEKIVLKDDLEIITPISVPSYTIIENLGKLQLANNATPVSGSASIFNIYNQSYVEIRGGIFDGNKTYNSGGNPPIQAKLCNNILFSNIIAHDSPHNGLQIRSSTHCIVQNCISYSNTYDGILINGGDSNTDYIIVSDNTCYNNGRGGIHIDGGTYKCRYVSLANNICYGQTGVTPVGTGIGTENVYDAIIANCHTYSNAWGGTNTGWGISIQLSERIIVLGCNVYNNGNSGIYIAENATKDCQVISCNIHDNGTNASANYRDGITVRSYADYNIFSGNRIKNHPLYEIRIYDNTCNKNLIHGNILLGTHTGTISNSGTGTVQADNVES